MKTTTSLALLAVGLVLGAVPSLLASTQGPSSVDIVVVVHQDGQPVEGLTARDFEVRQPGRVATVLAAEQVTARQWMLLFDLASPAKGWVPDARAAALEFVTNGLAETDRVGVAILGSDQQLRVVQPTLDRRLIAQAIAAVPEGTPGVPGATGDEVADEAREIAAGAERSSEGYERGQVYDSQARIQALAQSVQGLAGLLHAFGGNNHIVLLSSGVDLSAAMGNDLTARLDSEKAAREAEAAATGDIAGVGNRTFAGGGVVEQAVERAAEEAARRGCSVHGVEFSGSSDQASPRRARQLDGLWFLAERTGGEVARDPDSLSEAFAGLLRRTSVAYRLSVVPAKLKKAGGFHPLTVELADPSQVAEAPAGFYMAAATPEG